MLQDELIGGVLFWWLLLSFLASAACVVTTLSLRLVVLYDKGHRLQRQPWFRKIEWFSFCINDWILSSLVASLLCVVGAACYDTANSSGVATTVSQTVP